MDATAAITAHLDPETMARVETLSLAQGRSPQAFAEDAVRRVAEAEAEVAAFVQVGTDSADRGELIAHDEMFRRFYPRRAAREAAAAE